MEWCFLSNPHECVSCLFCDCVPYPHTHAHTYWHLGTIFWRFKQNLLKRGDCALTIGLKEYYVNWISRGLVWVKPIRLHSHAKGVSALSQSGSRYWRGQGLCCLTDRAASGWTVTPWAQGKACWEQEDTVSIMLEHHCLGCHTV